MKALKGKVAVVAGATRGAGRAIAVELGAAGATVYVTGRTTRENQSPMGRPETIEETAELVTARGGVGIAVRVDHTVEADVQALFERVREEQDGRLDLLVNDIWGGDPLTEWGVPFWEQSMEKGLQMQKQAVHSHMLNNRYGAPLMVERNQGLIIEITDGATYDYRGQYFYSLAKVSAIHLAEAMAADFLGKKVAVTALALTPGYLRSEAMLERYGVTEENWQEGAKHDPNFLASETPYYVARAVVALAGDPNVANKAGQALTSWDLGEEYGLRDLDGRQPHWGRHFAELIAK
ncbi:MAG TPA: SDR family oxidoreductase [Bacilli bacterium]|nr:SDR family oxidoreductase [Bacilli bacterium]